MSKSLLILCTFIMSFTGAVDGDAWRLTTKDEGIEVYTRKTKNSAFKEIRIKLVIEAPMDEFLHTLNDADHYGDWVFKCSKSYLVESLDEHSYIYYVKTDMPFPIRDRDLVVHAEQWEGPNGVIYSKSTAMPQRIPEEDGAIRIQKFDAHWEITPLEDDKIKIDYRSKTDPGGMLPAWVVNLGITKGPLESMKRLRKSLNEN